MIDATLDETRMALAPTIADNAGFDGWSADARELAADALGVDRDVARLALPTALTMIDAWFATIDQTMVASLPPERVADMKVRERITVLVEARLDAMRHQREGLRRALSVLAMPQNAATAARLGWRAVDAIWRAAGDSATDYNYYTKRTTLGAVYTATLLVFLNDESDGLADTHAFLARRVEGIMRFEKAKARLLGRFEHRPSLSRLLGRLRYSVA